MERRIFQFKLCQQTPKDPPLESDSFNIFHPGEACDSHALGVRSGMLIGTSWTKMLEFSGAVDSMHQVPCKLKIAELWNTSWQEQAEKCTQCPGPCRCKKVPVKGAKALTPVGHVD